MDPTGTSLDYHSVVNSSLTPPILARKRGLKLRPCRSGRPFQITVLCSAAGQD